MFVIGNISHIVKFVRYMPLLFAFYCCREQKELLIYERDKWLFRNNINAKSGFWGLLLLIDKFPEYRSLFYHRTGYGWLRHFARGQENLYFHTPSRRIGKGLIIWHGYSTVINADCIGEDCEIWHGVTIGKKTTTMENDRPVIHDRVKLCCNSVVLGRICIADDVVVGAGAVVVKSVLDPKSVVVSQPVRIISK